MTGRKKRRTGVVVSNKMDKTVVVMTHRTTKHPLYKKYIKKRLSFKAHDEKNACQIGDTVVVQEIRPLSKQKKWTVVEVIQQVV